jgi:Cdc6-like AAA superfamily ATPase
MNQRLTLLNDEPIGSQDQYDELDGLDFNRYAEVLARVIKDTNGPFTIGILGEWGTGKTSLMNMIENKLKNDDHIATVWFNAWRYEQDEHPIVPMVTTIIKALQFKKDFLIAEGERGKKFVKALRGMISAFSFKAKLNFPFVGNVESTLQPKEFFQDPDKTVVDSLMEQSVFFDTFEILNQASLSSNRKILVLIDDLDRCFPDRAVKILETIKLVLSQSNFIFVMGISRTVIEGYLKHRYKKNYGLEDFQGAQYLDKIIQLPFYLPPHSERMEQYAKELLSRLNIEEKNDFKDLIKMIGPASSNNPREAVRFVNKLIVAAEINENEIPIHFFAITFSLQQLWKNVLWEFSRSIELCQMVHTWNNDALKECQTFKNKKDASEKEVSAARLADIMGKDENLRKLMFSEIGRQWLHDHDMRAKTIHYLKSQSDTSPLEEQMAIIHSSRRYPKADDRFPGKKMYVFHAVIEAQENVLDQIDYVTYYLHSSYPNPVRVIRNRSERFKLKELAYGSSTLKAEVKLKDRQEPIMLSRHITLSETGTDV